LAAIPLEQDGKADMPFFSRPYSRDENFGKTSGRGWSRYSRMTARVRAARAIRSQQWLTGLVACLINAVRQSGCDRDRFVAKGVARATVSEPREAGVSSQPKQTSARSRGGQDAGERLLGRERAAVAA
jgi:hypothetical protein